MSSDSAARFEAATQVAGQDYVLQLYTVGATAAAQRAISNLRQICEQELQGRYTLEVIDITQRPELARQAQIIAVPTLIKALPEPIARLVGDLSNREKVIVGLDLLARPHSSEHG